MDPSSPFAQSSRQAQDKNSFNGPSTFSAFGQNGFGRAQMTPSKPLPPLPPLPPTPMQQQTPSIFASSRAQKTAAAPSFRNPAFTTPRKPFDIDAMSELSAAESSPAATDGSDFPETPDYDQSVDLAHMTITPASMSKHRSLFAKKASGKGEISKTLFPARDKVRKRKRHNADKDIGQYRLPYIQPDEGEGSDYESDESTFQPTRSPSKRRKGDGWFGSFLATLQRYPHAPSILGYWLNLGFSVASMTVTSWVTWILIGAVRKDFITIQTSVRHDILEEMGKCRAHFIDNKCSPRAQRLPAMAGLCEEWFACMNKNPDHLKRIQLGAKNIVEIVNEIVDTMSYKTMGLSVMVLALILFSGRSVIGAARNYPDFTRHAPPTYNQPHPSEHAAAQQVYWQAIQPQTPRHNLRHLPANDETPETDVSPPKYRALPPPETPSGRQSPSRVERGRSPTKSRSPTKRY
ncbi:hypothetical protein E0Z10_g4107 [Xylaria hypoxylon]|uniref:Brl1/Brr6 domain-containing protein n=1 Tax=Xylaria hypoxylon TaxID=37992 RepID=A0A4Z0Z1P2_9PEZI|nr:hypothetical protein E0Z10_g4107 [Xylaria hypoxylon]